MADFTFSLKSIEIDEKKIIEKHGLEKGGYVQQVIDSECLRLMDPMCLLTPGRCGTAGSCTPPLEAGRSFIGLHTRESSITSP